MIVFLDIDGVLRRNSSPPSYFQSDCLAHFESSIRPFDYVQIVISSSWRVAVSLKEMRRHFSADIAAKIVGTTPELEMVRRYTRFHEIIAYLADRAQENATWIAVDDSPELFPPDAPLLVTHSDQGFNGECALKLRQIVLATRKHP